MGQKSQTQFINDYKAANAETQRELREVFNKAKTGRTLGDDATEADVKAAVNESRNFFSNGRDSGVTTDPVVQPVTVNRDGDTNNFSISVDEAATPIKVAGAEAADRQTALATELAGINSMTVARVREIARTIASQDSEYLGNAATAEAALESAFNNARGS